MTTTYDVVDSIVDVVDAMAESIESDGLTTLLCRTIDVADVHAGAVLLCSEYNRFDISAVSDSRVKRFIETSPTDIVRAIDQCRNSAEPVLNDFRPADVPFSSYCQALLNDGFHHEYVIPLTSQGLFFGALLLLDRNELGIDNRRLKVAQSMAIVAATVFGQKQMLKQHQRLNGHLQNALESRIVIEQAKGIIAERDQLDVGSAFQILRQRARNQQRLLIDVAKEIVGKEITQQ